MCWRSSSTSAVNGKRCLVNFDFSCSPHLDVSYDDIVLDVTKEGGTVEQERVQRDATELIVRFSSSFLRSLTVALSPQLQGRQLIAVSDNIAQLTRMTDLTVRLSGCFRVVA